MTDFFVFDYLNIINCTNLIGVIFVIVLCKSRYFNIFGRCVIKNSTSILVSVFKLF